MKKLEELDSPTGSIVCGEINIAPIVDGVTKAGEAILKTNERDNKISEAIITFSAISSYNREEGFRGISGKDALLGRKIPSVNRHVESCIYAIEAWGEYFQGKKRLSDVMMKIHEIFMDHDSNEIFKPQIGKFRHKNIFISGEKEGIEHSCFIPVNHDKITDGVNFIEDFLRENTGKIPNTELIGRLHYYIAALHPFDDGNGRTARILSISLGIYLGEDYLRGFTFISEKLKVPGSDVLLYDSHLLDKSANDIIERIKKNGLTNEYQKDGSRILRGSKYIDFSDMMSEINIDSIGKSFSQLCEKVKLSEKYIYFLGEIIFEGRDLPGDHQLIWMFIEIIIRNIGSQLNNEVYDDYEFVVTKEVFELHIPIEGKKLKKASVRNIISLIERLRNNLTTEGIKITIDKSFFEEAEKRGLMPK